MSPQLQQQRSGQPQAGQQVPPSALPTHSVAHRCPSCGAAMRPHKSFCPNCGAQSTPVSQPPVQHPYAQTGTSQAAQPTQLAIPGGGQGIPSLEIESNLHGGKRTYALTKSVINIGRDPSNDIVIDEPVVSAFHVQIVRKGNQLILVHPHPSPRHTTNGLLYQNRHIVGSESFQKPLVCGDTFRIGNEHSELITLTYNDGSGAPQGIVPEIRLNPLGSPVITSGSQSQLPQAKKPSTTSGQVKAARVSAMGVVAAIITAMWKPQVRQHQLQPTKLGTASAQVKAARITAICGIVVAIITAILAPIILGKSSPTTSSILITGHDTPSSSTSPPPPSHPSVLILNSTYAGNVIAANGRQIPMNLYIDNETSNGDLNARVFYQTSPITQYAGTGAIGNNGHLTLTCANNSSELFLEGTVLSDGSIQGTDSIGGRWHVW